MLTVHLLNEANLITCLHQIRNLWPLYSNMCLLVLLIAPALFYVSTTTTTTTTTTTMKPISIGVPPKVTGSGGSGGWHIMNLLPLGIFVVGILVCCFGINKLCRKENKPQFKAADMDDYDDLTGGFDDYDDELEGGPVATRV